MSQDNSEKKSRRSKAKYPALQKKLNLKMRSDYIESDYINGVYDEKGNQVIRPLTDEEKQFLNDFYEETVNANFLHDTELRDIHKKVKELGQVKNPTQEQLEEFDYLNLLYQKRSDEALIYSNHKDQKKLYGENNARNRCAYNRAKASGMLRYIHEEYMNEPEPDYYDEGSQKNIYIDPMEQARKKALRKKNGEDNE